MVLDPHNAGRTMGSLWSSSIPRLKNYDGLLSVCCYLPQLGGVPLACNKTIFMGAERLGVVSFLNVFSRSLISRSLGSRSFRTPLLDSSTAFSLFSLSEPFPIAKWEVFCGSNMHYCN